MAAHASASSCEALLQDQIDLLSAKINGVSLSKYLATGAGAGAIGGVGVSLHQQGQRNSYVEGYNAGLTPGAQGSTYDAGYAAGFSGQTGADYLDGHQTAQYGSSQVPQKPNYLTNAAIGVGVGVGVGAAGFYVRKLLLKRKLNRLITLRNAFSPFAGEDSLAEAAKLVAPKAQKKNLDGLREKLADYNDQYCVIPDLEISVKSVKKYLKNVMN